MTLLADRRFAPLFLCQLLSAFGDNLLRNALGVLALFSLAGGPAWMVPAAAGAFVLPGLVLSGLGGELADRMDKARLVRRLKLAELPVAGLAALGLAGGRPGVVLAALGLSGVVSALFGPVKYGILPDQLAAERLPAANALVEGATFAAILAGTLGAGLLMRHGEGAGVVGGIVVAVAAASWASACAVPSTVPAAPALVPRANLLASTADLLRELRADRRSWRAALALAWFWMVGAAVLSLLPGLVRDVLYGDAATNSLFLVLFAVGVAGGSALASLLAGGRTLLVTAGLGCGLIGLALLAAWRLAGVRAVEAGAVEAGVMQAGAQAGAPWPLCLALFVAALGAGLLAVPTQAAVQAWAVPARRARAVGGSNVLAALGMVVTSAALVLAQLAGAGEASLLGVTGLLCLGMAPPLLRLLPASPGSELAWVLLRPLVRIRLLGADCLPGSGEAAVVLARPGGWLEAAALLACLRAPPLLAVDAGLARRWWVRLLPGLRVATGPGGLRAMVRAVQGGARLLVLLPGGADGADRVAVRVAVAVAGRAGVPVVPVRLQWKGRGAGVGADGFVGGQLRPRMTVTVLPPLVGRRGGQLAALGEAAVSDAPGDVLDSSGGTR